jgi:methylglutaconyl-CoA hydratase
MKNLRIDRMDPLLAIRLDRADRRNAFDDELIADLTEAFQSAAKDPAIRVVLLSGEGDSFCAGADLEWMRRAATYTEEQNRADALHMAAMFDAIATCPHPVIARVHGGCMGGGIGLVAASDIAVASHEAIFGFTEVRLGLIPAVISPYVLAKVRPGDASRYFLTGERFIAEDALRIGLVQIVADAGQLEGTLNALIAELLAGAPTAQGEAKRLLREVPHLDRAQAQETTAAWIARLRASKEGREGIHAFLEHRPPAWRGHRGEETS